MGGWVVVAGEAEDYVPEHSQTSKQIEDQWPLSVVVLQHQSSQSAGHHCAYLVTWARRVNISLQFTGNLVAGAMNNYVPLVAQNNLL